MPVVVEEYRAPNSTCANDSLYVTSFFATEVPRSDDGQPTFPAFLNLAIDDLPNQTVALVPLGEINYFWVKARVVSRELQDCPNNTTEFTNEAEQAFANNIQNDMNAVPIGISSDTSCDNNRLISDMTAIVLLPGVLPSTNATNMTFAENNWWPTQFAAATAAPIVAGQQANGEPCGSDGDCAASGRRKGVSCVNNVCSGAVAESSCCAALDCDGRIKKCMNHADGTCYCKLNRGGIALIVILSVFGGFLLCILLTFLLLFSRGKKGARSPAQQGVVEDPAMRAPHLEKVQT